VSWLRTLLWRLARCRHVDVAGTSITYRERRRLPGSRIEVLHLVCARCGHAAPMVDRPLAAQRRVVEIGRTPNYTRASRAACPARVRPFDRRAGS